VAEALALFGSCPTQQNQIGHTLRGLLVGRIVFGEVVRHCRSTLQQRLTASSDINDNELKKIPGLMRQSGLKGTAILLFSLNRSPGLNDNPTKLSRHVPTLRWLS
jgi:hypothetical protein